MARREQSRPSLKNIRALQLSMIIGYAVIIIAVVFVVAKLAVNKTDAVLKNKVISMTSSLNVQMKLNMDSYISRMETIGTLAFGSEEAYTYDATDPNNDEYEALNTEKAITEKLYSLCIMDNFCDYGIVYRNNRTVGKISNGTSSLMGDTMYEELSSMITRQNDGWCAGYKGDLKRIYYVKRVHDNAVLVVSFYASELEAVFDNPETLADMDIRLVNSDYDILYSSRGEETGGRLPDDIVERVQGKTSATVMDDDYLVSVNSCVDDWYVICSIPTRIILNEKNDMRYFIYMVGLIAAFLAVLFGSVLSLRLTRPVKKAVAILDTKANNDQLTGIFNKLAFNDRVAERLDSSLSIERHALILLDLDNFKGVNDTLGHAYGDKVLAKTGSILRAEFSTEDFLGRVGGDEFCVLVNSSPSGDMSYEDFIREKCETLCGAYRAYYSGDGNDYKISASIGVSLFPEHGSTFEELYAASDKALYTAKNGGKDTYALYDGEKSGEVADE
ncbi:MAG: diguanylate cyclase [Ruminococcus sp.]|nr:diguanylate cyclase [Ruminococcus sp.]